MILKSFVICSLSFLFFHLSPFSLWMTQCYSRNIPSFTLNFLSDFDFVFDKQPYSKILKLFPHTSSWLWSLFLFRLLIYIYIYMNCIKSLTYLGSKVNSSIFLGDELSTVLQSQWTHLAKSVITCVIKVALNLTSDYRSI